MTARAFAREHGADVAIVAGAAAVVTGVALWSGAAAWIMAGLFRLAGGILWSVRGERRPAR